MLLYRHVSLACLSWVASLELESTVAVAERMPIVHEGRHRQNHTTPFQITCLLESARSGVLTALSHYHVRFDFDLSICNDEVSLW